MVKVVSITVLLLVLCSNVSAESVHTSSQLSLADTERYVDSLMQANHGPAYKRVNKFLLISVSIQQGEELGLNETELQAYAGLRFKNNFAMIELDRKLRGVPFSEYPPEERDAVHGIIRFEVWTIGTDYPIAYHISFRAGTLGPTEELTDLDRYSDAVLGYCAKTDMSDAVKRAIDSMMEGFAIVFFKARGEL